MNKNIVYSFVVIIPIIALASGFLLGRHKPQNSTTAPNHPYSNDADMNYDSRSNEIKSDELIRELANKINGLDESMKKRFDNNSKRLRKMEVKIAALTNEKTEAEPEETETGNVIDPQNQFELERRNRIERALSQTRIMDEALAHEERDEVWAPEMEEMILSVSENEAYSGTTFTSPVCKSTFCSFEAYHSDEKSKEQFENMRREIPNSYHIQHFEEPGGMVRSVMYLIKRGEEYNSVVFNTLNSAR